MGYTVDRVLRDGAQIRSLYHLSVGDLREYNGCCTGDDEEKITGALNRLRASWELLQDFRLKYRRHESYVLGIMKEVKDCARMTDRLPGDVFEDIYGSF